jgi:hypothetical protein
MLELGATMDDQRTLAFFHIMKCGGTSVRVGLAWAAAGRRDGPGIFELNGDIAKVAAGGGRLSGHEDNWRFRDALLPYVVLAMRPAVILGHFRYRDRYESLLDSAHFVTVLRNPVDRIVSLYKYRRYKEGVDIPITTSLEEFLASTRWAKEGHAYVNAFCGRDGLEPRSDEAIGAAIANLRRFAVVGFTERLDEFADQVASCLGRRVSIPAINRSPAPDGVTDPDVAADALERARVICAPDLHVYQEALKMHAATHGVG